MPIYITRILTAILTIGFSLGASAVDKLTMEALFHPNTTYPYFDDSAPFGEAAPDQFDIHTAHTLAQASMLSYVKENEFIESKLKTLNFHEVHFFASAGTFAYLAVNDTDLILCFRGTESGHMNDYITDSKIVQKKFKNLGTAHRGFIKAFEVVAEDIDNKIIELTKESPHRLWVTGHSLGGALATLYGIHQHTLTSAVYTIGCPRVGGVDFSKHAESLIHLYRIINDNDIVARFPTPPFYRHIDLDYFIDANGKLIIDPPMKAKWQSHNKGHMNHIKRIFNEHWSNGDFNTVPSDYLVDHSPRLYVEAIKKLAEESPSNSDEQNGQAE